MILEDLTKDDKNILLSGVSQLVYIFILIAISLIVFLIMAVHVLHESQDEFVLSYRDVLVMLSVGITAVVYGFWAWIKLAKPLQNMLSGKKQLVVGIVSDKKTNTKWGWHGVIPADFVSQPRLVEYLLEIDKEQYLVEKDFYNAIQIGDTMELSFSYPNRQVILMRTIPKEV